MARDKQTQQFLSTPEGQKTPKMLEVEKKLGQTLEDDFQEYYVEKQWGQKRLAQRWGVKKNQIFSTSMRGGRRCWAQMLNLPVRRLDSEEPEHRSSYLKPLRGCEICGVADLPLDDAHWVPASNGGSDQPHNILHLCPNCHRRLDTGNTEIESKAKSVLLFREVNKLLMSPLDDSEKKSKLVELAIAIIERKPIK